MTLAFFSVMTLGILVNWYGGALLAFTIFFYVVIYTMWLKRWTAQNIVIGGAAGSLPPVVAWVAATGSISVEPLLLFLIIFFWTPPHFWALALFRSDDYARAGVPMLPVVAGPDATRLQILLYTIVLVAIAARALAARLFRRGLRHHLAGSRRRHAGAGGQRLSSAASGREALRATRRLFAFSIFYLFALFATLLIEVVVRALYPRSGKGRMATHDGRQRSQTELSSRRRRRRAAVSGRSPLRSRSVSWSCCFSRSPSSRGRPS